MEKKAYATNIMLVKFTIRWGVLDNFVTSLNYVLVFI